MRQEPRKTPRDSNTTSTHEPSDSSQSSLSTRGGILNGGTSSRNSQRASDHQTLYKARQLQTKQSWSLDSPTTESSNFWKHIRNGSPTPSLSSRARTSPAQQSEKPSSPTLATDTLKDGPENESTPGASTSTRSNRSASTSQNNSSK